MNQIDLEKRMAEDGWSRAYTAMSDAEKSGNADRNPYAATIYRNFVTPLAELLSVPRTASGGKPFRHYQLLRDLDPWATAYIAVRACLVFLLDSTVQEHTARKLANHVGYNVHAELFLKQFHTLSPDLAFVMHSELGRRKSRDLQHKLQTFRKGAKTHHLGIVEWSLGDREVVGSWLVTLLTPLGLLTLPAVSGEKGLAATRYVALHPQVEEDIAQVREHTAFNRPLSLPFVEPPLDWKTFKGGGWHTEDMHKRFPYCVRARTSVKLKLVDHPIPKVLECINTLQRTAFTVNQKLLDILPTLAANVSSKELAIRPQGPAPPKPEFLGQEGKLTPEQEDVFTTWKRGMAEWYTAEKLRKVSKLKLAAAIRVAKEFQGRPLYFMYFCDSRGRVYPRTSGISPQGSDLQKALLKFHIGKPLADNKALQWWYIHGANMFGEDKGSLKEASEWHIPHKDVILACADNPLDNLLWLEAKKPFRFLAWCFEYAEREASPRTFLSHLAVSMDASCSGLQHFSAMLRDEIGGEATNLTRKADKQDAYGRVAKLTFDSIVGDSSPLDGVSRGLWLTHGVSRDVVKRSTMTTVYGVTRRTATQYVCREYVEKQSHFPKKGQYAAATYLISHAWPAIAQVVVKARAAMDWLIAAAKHIVDTGQDVEGTIYWISPSGMLASQTYNASEGHRVTTHLHGKQTVLMLSEKEEASRREHSSGLAPNFIQSMDASHLHLVVCAMNKSVPGCSLAMVHDDFGTHAADTQVLYEVVRKEFVQMYTDHNPLQEFKDRYTGLPDIPAQGNLDIKEVLESEHAFR